MQARSLADLVKMAVTLGICSDKPERT
jgi:hypothetical protein